MLRRLAFIAALLASSIAQAQLCDSWTACQNASGEPLIYDPANPDGVCSLDGSGTLTCGNGMTYASGVLEIASLAGSGTRCVQVDALGNLSAPTACAAGSVTSVNGTAGRTVVSPSSPNPTVDLATFGTASTCTYATTVTDAYGRTTCTNGTANADVLLGNPTGSPANVSEIGLGTGLGFSGTNLVNTSPLSSLTALAPLFISGTQINIHGAVTTGGTSTSPTNLGALGSGVLEQTVSGGVSTPAVYAATNLRIPFGNTTGGLQDSSNIIWNSTAMAINIAANRNGTNVGFQVANSNAAAAAQSGLFINNDLGSPGAAWLTLSGSGAAQPALASVWLANQCTTGGGIVITTAKKGIGFATARLATTATDGFLMLQSCAGAPTGAPNTTFLTGNIPVIVNDTNDRLVLYNGSWKVYGQFDGGLTGAPGILKTDASGIHSIAVSGTDYQPAGSYITALTGDVTATGPGSVAATIGANKVTYTKVQQASAHVLIGNPTGSTANVSEITLGSGLAFSGTTLTATGSGGTVTSVTGTAPIAVATGTTTPVISLNIDSTLAIVSSNLGRAAISGDVLISAGSNTSAFRAGAALSVLGNPGSTPATFTEITAGVNGDVLQQIAGVLGFAPLNYSSIVGTVPAITQLTGDVTAGPGSGSQVATLHNIPNDVAMAGDLLATTIVAPSAPSTGHVRVYVDSTSFNLAAKNASGVVNHGIQSNAGTSHKWVSAIADDGTVTLSQPSYTDLSGSVPAITALTGDGTATGPGSASLAVFGIHDGGSGSGVDYQTSGTWSAGQFLRVDVGGGNLLAAGTISGDGTSITTSNSGIPPENLVISRAALTGDVTAAAGSNTTSIAPSVVASKVTKQFYTFFGSVSAGLLSGVWITPGGLTPTTGTPIEYPNDFKASSVQVRMNISVNSVTSGTLSFALSMNGVGIAGTGFSVTSTSPGGVQVGSQVPTGSTSANDAYGLFFETSTGFTSGFCAVTFEVTLTQ